jgi:hypothetical protein
MNNKEFDLDNELQNLNDRYQAESTENPPEFLDKSILQAAHNAVQEKTSGEIKPFSSTDEKVKVMKRAWYVPMTFVAMLVISLSVVLKLAFDPTVTEQMPEVDGRAPAATTHEQYESVVPVEEPPAELDRRRQIMQAQSASAQKMTESVAKRKQLKRSLKQPSLSTYNEKKAGELSFDMPVEKEETGAKSAKMAAIAAVTQPPAADLAVSAGREIRIKSLLKLYDSGNLSELRPALQQYRKDYPLEKYTNQLPDKLRELEIKWKSEKQLKTR